MSDKINLEDYNFEEEDHTLDDGASVPIDTKGLGSYDSPYPSEHLVDQLSLPTPSEDEATDQALPPLDIHGGQISLDEPSMSDKIAAMWDWMSGDEKSNEKPDETEDLPDALPEDWTGPDLTKDPKGGKGSAFFGGGHDSKLVQEVQNTNRNFLEQYPTWKPPKIKDWKEWTGSDQNLYEKQLEVAEASSDAIDEELSKYKQKDQDIAQTQLVLKMLDALALLAAAHMGIESDLDIMNFDEYYKQRRAFHQDVTDQAIKNLRVRKADQMASLSTQEMDRKEYNQIVRQNAVQTYNAGIQKFGTKYKMFTNEVNLRYKMGKDKQSLNIAKSKAKGRGGMGGRMAKALEKQRKERFKFIRKNAKEENARFSELANNALGDERTDKDTENYEDEIRTLKKKRLIDDKMADRLLNAENASDARAILGMPQWKMITARVYPEHNANFSGGSGNIQAGVGGNKTSRRRVNYKGEPHYEWVERDIESGQVLRVLGYEPIKD